MTRFWIIITATASHGADDDTTALEIYDNKLCRVDDYDLVAVGFFGALSVSAAVVAVVVAFSSALPFELEMMIMQKQQYTRTVYSPRWSL